MNMRFQSTHSLRSATQQETRIRELETVSIHALLAECDASGDAKTIMENVSIHALLAECDLPALPIHPAG